MDKKEFEKIYEKYFKDVYFFLLSLTKDEVLAEDLTADTFYKALVNLDNLKDTSKIKSWIFSIGKNEFLMYERKNKNLVDMEDEYIFNIKDDIDIEENTIIKLSYEDLMEKVLQMKEENISLFILRGIGEFSYEEISERLDRSPIWCRVNYHRICKILRNSIDI